MRMKQINWRARSSISREKSHAMLCTCDASTEMAFQFRTTDRCYLLDSEINNSSRERVVLIEEQHCSPKSRNHKRRAVPLVYLLN